MVFREVPCKITLNACRVVTLLTVEVPLFQVDTLDVQNQAFISGCHVGTTATFEIPLFHVNYFDMLHQLIFL